MFLDIMLSRSQLSVPQPGCSPAEMNGPTVSCSQRSRVCRPAVVSVLVRDRRPSSGFHSYTAPFCKRSGVKQPLVLQLLSALLVWDSFFRAFQRWASGSMNSEREDSR